MFKNYLRTAVRSLGKSKGYSFINVLGLSIGIAVQGFYALGSAGKSNRLAAGLLCHVGLAEKLCLPYFHQPADVCPLCRPGPVCGPAYRVFSGREGRFQRSCEFPAA